MPDQRIPAVIRGTSSSADGWCQVSAQYVCTGKPTESIEYAYLFANMATPDLIAFYIRSGKACCKKKMYLALDAPQYMGAF